MTNQEIRVLAIRHYQTLAYGHIPDPLDSPLMDYESADRKGDRRLKAVIEEQADYKLGRWALGCLRTDHPRVPRSMKQDPLKPLGARDVDLNKRALDAYIDGL